MRRIVYVACLILCLLIPTHAQRRGRYGGEVSDWAEPLLEKNNAADARTYIGLGTGDSPQFTAIELGHATDTTLSRPAAGRVQIEGVEVAKGTPTLGHIPVGNGTTFTNQVKPVFDVLDYGADPTESAANNTTYIQAAIDAAKDAGGGTVKFRGGTYEINDALTLNSTTYNGVILKGVSRDNSRIEQTGADKDVFILSGNVRKVHFENLWLEGDSVNLDTDSGIVLNGSYETTVYNCRITNHGEYGVWVTGSVNAYIHIQNTLISQNVDDQINAVADAGNADRCNSMTIENCDISSTDRTVDRAGIRWGGNGLAITGGSIQSCKYGVVIVGDGNIANGFNITDGVYFEDQDTYDIWLASVGNIQGGVIQGNFYNSSNTSSIIFGTNSVAGCIIGPSAEASVAGNYMQLTTASGVHIYDNLGDAGEYVLPTAYPNSWVFHNENMTVSNPRVDPAMASALTFASWEGPLTLLTPTADRNYNPTGTFLIGTEKTIQNLDTTYNITFDSTGIASVIKPGQAKRFYYNGSAWAELGILTNPTITTPTLSGDLTGDDSYFNRLQNFQDLQATGPGYWADGTNDKITVSDTLHLSFGNATTDTPFSIIARVAPDDLTSGIILYKSVGAGTDREYKFGTTASDEIELFLEDDSTGGWIRGVSTAAITTDNAWRTIAGTYDGTESSSGITLYENGAAVATTAGSSGSYTAMENEGGDISTFFDNSGTYSGGHVSMIRVFNKELTAAEVKEYSTGAPIPFKYIGANQTEQTSGTLTVGKAYRLNDFIAGDDFSNIGATNEDENEFVATGTTPTTWTNSSTVVPIGAVLQLEPTGITSSTWADTSGNNLDGTVSGAVANNLLDTVEIANFLDVGGGTATSIDGTDDLLVKDDAEIDGHLYVEEGITGDGSHAVGGFLKTVTDDTDGKTLTVAESGTVQTNAGAGGAAAWILPTAAAGLEYFFVVGAAQELRVTPAAGDNINYGGTAMAAAEYYYADAIGEALHIIAIDATQWVVITSTGTWAEQTP